MSSCVKPELNLPAVSAICDDPDFLDAEVIDAQFPDYPDVEPPPHCFCINDKQDIETDPDESSVDIVSNPDDLKMDVTMVMTNDECCDPRYSIVVDADIPCMPFDFTPSIGFSKDSTTSVQVTRLTEEEVPDPENPGETITVPTCEFEIDITVPTQAEMAVKIVHSGPGITYIKDCEPPSLQEGVKVTAEWSWDNVLLARMLTLNFHIDFGIPLIGKLIEATGDVDTTIPGAADSEPGKATLGPDAINPLP